MGDIGGNLVFEHRVADRLQGKPHLEPLLCFGVYDIPRRLREYDPSLFVVRNHRRRRFEVHSVDNKGSTFCCDVPYDQLDSRVEEAVKRGNIRVRGPQIFQEIDEYNERLERSMKRARRTELEGIAEEMHPYFRDDAWQMPVKNW